MIFIDKRNIEELFFKLWFPTTGRRYLDQFGAELHDNIVASMSGAFYEAEL